MRAGPGLLLTAILAGCFAACPAVPTSVAWNDPELFQAIDGEATPAMGLPVAGVWLVELDHRVPLPEGGNFRLTGQGISQAIRGGESDEDVEAGLRRFLQNVTSSYDEDYVRGFMESRQVTGEGQGPAGRAQAIAFHGPVPDRLRIDALYAETVGDQARARNMAGADWAWHLAYPFKSTVLGPGNLTVDEVGVAEFDHTWQEDPDPAQMEADVRRWLEEAGLPVPMQMEVRQSYCD